MHRSLALLGATLLLLVSSLPALAAEGDPGTVMIMKHACTEEPVRTEADFEAIEAQAGGDEITALALTVLACPTIVLTEDESGRTDGVAGPAVDFDFSITDANGDTQTLADAEFMAAKLCESDIERDANGDGEFSADVCLDISHYVFSNVAVGEVTVEETSPPNGWRFGTNRLTPQALQAEGSDDAQVDVDVDVEAATVTLDLSGDEDNTVMLHIYNFEDSPATDTAPGFGSADSGSFGGTALAAAGLLGLLLVGAFTLRRRMA